MTHAAIYARFSTDRQSESSIDAQERLCRLRAEALGLQVVIVHADRAVSGSVPVAKREAGRALLADALAGRFKVLLMEGLHRLSRDIGEQDGVVKRLEYRGVRIIGCSDGYDSTGAGRKVMRVAHGLMNEVYLDTLRASVHRTLAHKATHGHHVAGLSYGYRSVPDGTGRRLEVVEEQATIVREIYARFAAGESCQRIASDLNVRGVHGPRGHTWSVSALYGTPDKGAGLLNNELYVGRYVWNRSQWMKDPDTGRRTRFVRPRSEWLIDERPYLRIVDGDTWSRVRARIGSPIERRAGKARRTRGGAATTLFGGILRCARCGGAMIAINARQYGCAARKDRGLAVCHGTLTPRGETDRRLVASIRDQLTSTATIAQVRREAAQALVGQAEVDTARAARLAALEREIGRLADAVAQLGLSEALRTRLTAAEAERADLLAAASVAAETPTPDDVVEAYRRNLLRLTETLERDIGHARAALAQVLGRITVEQIGVETWAEMETRQGPMMLAAGAYPGLVAGEGFEPSTFGL